MSWRVIARIGYTNDKNSAMRNHIAEFLKGAGLINTRTGTWETPAIELADASRVLAEVLSACADPKKVPGIDREAKLKHLWLYLDEADGDDISSDDVDKAEMYSYDRSAR